MKIILILGNSGNYDPKTGRETADSEDWDRKILAGYTFLVS